MRHHKLNYLVVGVFVIAMIGVTLGSIFLISGQSRETDAYYLVMDNVADVKFGTQIRYEGYPIGQIERISPFVDEDRMRFRVEVSIERDWRLPRDSIARIGSSSLLSAKTIDVTAGNAPEALAPGDEIPSAAPKDVFAAVTNLADEFGALNRDGLRPLVNDIGAMVRRLGARLETDLTQLTGSLNGIAGSVEGRSAVILARVDRLTRRLDERILSERNAAAVEGMLADATDTSHNIAELSRDLRKAGGRVAALSAELEGMVAANRGNLDKALTNAQYSLQTIARNIDSIMQSIDVASRNMSEFSRLIRQNPSLLLGGPPREQVAPTAGRFRGVAQ